MSCGDGERWAAEAAVGTGMCACASVRAARRVVVWRFLLDTVYPRRTTTPMELAAPERHRAVHVDGGEANPQQRRATTPEARSIFACGLAERDLSACKAWIWCSPARLGPAACSPARVPAVDPSEADPPTNECIGVP